MQPTEAELQAHFQQQGDEQSQDVARDPDGLTDLAREALNEGLVSRRLTPPASALPEPAVADHVPTTWVTVDRFRDLSLAIVARSALEAASIPCFLRDENTVRLDWQISNFIGGMRLQVPEHFAAQAEEVLQEFALPVDAEDSDELGQAADDDLVKGAVCPHCGSTDTRRTTRFQALSAAVLFLFTLPVPRGGPLWKCDACGWKWPAT